MDCLKTQLSILFSEEEDFIRKQRFRDAYDTVARAPKDELQKELDRLLAFFKKERVLDSETSDEITGGIWFLGIPIKQGHPTTIFGKISVRKTI